MQRPILPARLALDLLAEVKAFVSATLYVRDAATRDALLRCLFEESPMVQGPFFQLRLPFRSIDDAEWPLHPQLRAKFSPYVHQLKAWKRLVCNPPEHTLVTTGTGSGKSECFILPILDYVLRQKTAGKPSGVKALILYPMNALIDDQGERLAREANRLNKELELHGEHAIRVGRYTGGDGRTRELNEKSPLQVIDSREALCSNPPDILLTNYRMLDFMLYRPEEQAFWDEKTRSVFRFLVLDELHTFDGAQGADVACLIRRLRLKLQSIPFCCVGTSATIAGGNIGELCGFASKLFGEEFGTDDVVREEVLSKGQCLRPINSVLSRQPRPVVALPTLIGGGEGAYETYVQALCARWGASPDAKAAGEWLLSHPLLHALLEAEGKWESLSDAAERCAVSPATLAEFLDLVGWSRRENGRALFPLQLQIWTQESRRLGRELSLEPRFVRMVEGLNEGESSPPHVLPAINCHECGAAGWVTQFQGEWDSGESLSLIFDRSAILNAYRLGKAHILFPRPGTSEKDGTEVHYSRTTGRLHKGSPTENDEDVIPLVFRLQENSDDRMLARKKGQKGERPVRCPECDKHLALRMSAVGSSLLTSVLSGAYLSHPANPDDRKLLIFNDSVQDAAHQAGYVSHRSFRFGLRRFVASCVRGSNGPKIGTLAELVLAVREEILRLCLKAHKEPGDQSRDARLALATLIPLDLWQRWEHEGTTQRYFEADMAGELAERLGWEAWFELTLSSGLGWSLRKTGQAGLEPKPAIVQVWKEVLQTTVRRHPEAAALQQPEAFIQGILRRFISSGAVFHGDLLGCYSAKKFSFWPIRNGKSHLRGLFSFGTSLPGVVSLRGPSDRSEREGVAWVLSSKGGASWFEQWGKHHGLTKPAPFYIAFFEELAARSEAGLIRPRESVSEDFVLREDALEIRTEGYRIFRCSRCAHLEAIAFDNLGVELKCSQYRCTGAMKPADGEADAFRSYMQQYYNRPLVGTWAHAHTGQLDATDRRCVEDAFKQDRLPGDMVESNGRRKVFRQHPVNILACTPTMEMGIDIGDLSAVFLRSFPRTIANSNQRMGRSGRKTGNAVNVAITRLVPHDLHYWNNPKSLLHGQVVTPGCEFTNKQVLWRQFNAFCLDIYASKRGFESLPRASETDDSPLCQHPFWRGFREFLKGEARDHVAPFLDEFFRIQKGTAGYALLKSLDSFFTQEIERETLWSAIAEALGKTDARLAKHRKQKGELKAKTEANASGTHEASEKPTDPDASPESDLIQAEVSETGRLGKVWEELQQETYIFSTLGSLGVLPNYAFPESGVQFQASVRLPDETQANGERPKPRYKSVSISRPPVQGLRELAPGQSYYLDGFKVPVVRVETDPKTSSFWRIFCKECGETSDVPKDQMSGELELRHQDCPGCGAKDQVLLPVVDFVAAIGRSEFDRAQIRDSEEERERKAKSVMTFVNYSTGEANEHAAWVSDSEGLGVEFRTHARIVHANLGDMMSFDEPKGFEVCAECGAIPVHRKENGETVTEFKGMATENINRHRFGCKYFLDPNSATSVHIGLTRELRSDVIRFTAAGREEVPALEALLAFAMKVLLGGNPGHIVSTHSELRSLGRGYRHIVTLFDNIPGGSGHLLSLMSFSKAPGKSLEEMKKLFKKTLEKLQSCSCQRGCYQCLLTYENQGSHHKIQKNAAIQWLERFLAAKDWIEPGRSLAQETRDNSVFDGYAEEFLVEGIEAGIRSGCSGIPGAEWFKPVRDAEGTVYEMGGSKLQQRLFVEVSHSKKVQLTDGRYTKPDFWLYTSDNSPASVKTLVAYLYVDGRDTHLDPGEDHAKTLERDVNLRSQLEKDSGRRVITLTYQMIEAWRDLRKTGELQPLIPAGNASLHILNAWIIRSFLNEKSKALNLPQNEGLVLRLLGSFVSGVFEELLEPERPWFSNMERTRMNAALKALCASPELIAVSNLSFNPTKNELVLDASEDSRLDRGGGISFSFARDWSVWWIVSQIARTSMELAVRVKT